jgi:hypothetical protein
MTACRKLAAITLLLCFALLLGSGCDKLNINVPGKVQGQCLDSSGAGRGYISVALKNVETGKEDYQMNAEDSGNFFFDGVEPGKYIIITYGMGKTPIPNDSSEFNVTPGKTVMKNVTLGEMEKSEGQGGM